MNQADAGSLLLSNWQRLNSRHIVIAMEVVRLCLRRRVVISFELNSVQNCYLALIKGLEHFKPHLVVVDVVKAGVTVNSLCYREGKRL